MELIFGIILGLIVLIFLVVVHELGHAIAARKAGVVVEEFGIGFPPRAWGKKLKNGVLFSLNWLPLGGFVKLQGENDSATKKGDYGRATFWQKTKILFAGVAVNLLIAVLILTGLSLVGLPKIVQNQFSVAGDSYVNRSAVQVTSVQNDYPAAQAGITQGDKILSIDDTKIDTTEQLIELTKASRGEKVEVTYEREGQESTVSVPLRDADSAVFGASLGQQETIRSTWSAPIVGIGTTIQFVVVTFQGLGNLVSDFFSGLFLQLSPNEATRDQGAENIDRASNSVAGPVGLLGTIFPAVGQAGPVQILFLAAIISLSLAVMNMLPIPALDGGRWFVTALFRVMKKPLTKDVEERIHGIGFMALMGLVVLITVADVAKFF